MPNPSGANGFQGFAPEEPYGQKIQQKQLQQAAPLPDNPALASAKTAQRRAVRGKRGGAAPAPVPAVPSADPGQPVTYAAQLAQTWAALAATPGSSPLIQQLAQEAQAAVGA